MSKQKLSKDELSKLQELNNAFTQAKISLGDAEIQKVGILTSIQEIKKEFSALENELIKNYGDQSVINLQTGEVTDKKE
jgi:hypothetical protein|tara:strand:+ start:448 stop:684 length:237 start_codon:yes stop_codon:yes gene_type:complete